MLHNVQRLHGAGIKICLKAAYMKLNDYHYMEAMFIKLVILQSAFHTRSIRVNVFQQI